MSMSTLNVGVLAHVDAGKTSLTERLLFHNGVIPQLGSVDAGDTQTDASDVERRRGITVRSAVASFNLPGLQINLVDTPGHPDFVAEVERALSVLDAAILVISAVEGVQAQTRVLMRSLRRMRLPTLIFVNKIDRVGARYGDLLADIRTRLTPLIVPMEQVDELGGPPAGVTPRSFDDAAFCGKVAEVLAGDDDRLLSRVLYGTVPGGVEMQRLLRERTSACRVHPVFFGSALSGAGTSELLDAMRTLLLPRHQAETDDNPRGTVFAIERAGSKEKIAYLRLFSGQLHERQRVTFHRRDAAGAVEEYSGRITRLEVLGGSGMRTRSGPLTAGNIAKLRGVPEIRVGDRLGEPDAPVSQRHFSPPILESVVRARQAGQ